MSAIIWPEENFLVSPGAFLPRTDRHFLGGTVKDDGTPVSRRLALFSRTTLQCLAVTRSRRDGTYEFRGIPEYPEKSLFIVAFDDEHEGTHNAECADFLTQIEEPTE